MSGTPSATVSSTIASRIAGQQISAAVAFTVYDRIAAAAGGIPTPEGVTGLRAGRLHEVHQPS